jgi:uncharacterized membrane protein HdeD (DUF308 family)
MAEAMAADQPVDTARGERRSLKDWVGWYYVPGIAFLVVGILALAEPPLASLAASIYVGAMLCVAGAFMTVGGIANLSHRGGWIGLVLGLLSLVTGFIMLRNPGIGAVSLVRVLGAWLIAGGILEVAIGFNIAVGRGWLILVSLINIVLGVFVLRMQPGAAFHFLGYFVGVSLVLQGLWSLLFTADLKALRRSLGTGTA